MQAAQFFPKERRVENILKHICQAYGVTEEWQNLAPFFDSISFTPAENQHIWVDLGNRDYRIGFKIPGLATERSPNFDFGSFAKLVDLEEDILTVKWKKNFVTVYPGDSPGRQMDLVSGIPYPEKEQNSFHLEAGNILSVLPTHESKVKLAVTETSLLSVREQENTRLLSKTDILGGKLEDDYFLEIVSPPASFLASEPVTVKVSHEGLLFSQPDWRAYCAAEKTGDAEFYLPRQDTSPVEVVSSSFSDLAKAPPAISQQQDILKVAGLYGTLELVAPGLQPRAAELPVSNELVELLLLPREADVAICQFPDQSLLLACASHRSTLFATITCPCPSPVPLPVQLMEPDQTSSSPPAPPPIRDDKDSTLLEKHTADASPNP